jgi:autotransporter-associated beta strand protein
LFTRQGGRIILNGANTYSGGTRLSSGTTGVGIDSDGGLANGPFGTGSLTIEGNIGLFASGGDRTVGNSVVYTAGGGTLTFTDTDVLTMSGSFDLGSGGISSAVNRTIAAATDAKGIISGVISDSSFPGCGLTKSGNGTLYLNAANTYTGPTTNTAGVLAGTGSIPGSVVVTGGGIGGGSPSTIGTLTVGGDVTFNGGGASIRVNRSGSQSDKVSVTGTLNASAAGTITVTNLGATLQAGDNFVLFPGKTVTGGSALAVTGAGVTWTNKLEVDGSIQVLSTVSTTPPTLTNSVSGNTLTLSWPATHLGWSLQAQTNNLNVGIANNWVTVPGTAGVTSTNITINPANPTVFYRLFYVTP